MNPADRAVRIRDAEVRFIPVQTRTPYKFGNQSLDRVTCARVRLVVESRDGRTATGWGETPLSVAWAWPGGNLHRRLDAMLQLCRACARELPAFAFNGHPLEISLAFQKTRLKALRDAAGAVPYLPALVCLSAFDLALYDAFGILHDQPVFDTLGPDWMRESLASYLEADVDARLPSDQPFPEDFLVRPRPDRLTAWHAVGASDALVEADLNGDEPQDGYPNTLEEWIRRDGLTCLKIKLTGQDYPSDLERIRRIGEVGAPLGIQWLCTDFNSTVAEVRYVTDILDALERDHPETFARILYVEQPFPYEMADSPADVRPVSDRKPLYMDESAHDWHHVREGRARGWTGVALKTCKTLTNALLMLAWARAHGMEIMVQDLTNPRMAQVTHALLAAHAGTVMGLETNSMQYYPEASRREAEFHPGLYRRQHGELDLSTLHGPGFGYGPITGFDASAEP